jgi:small-conductance mechanosensitive channel
VDLYIGVSYDAPAEKVREALLAAAQHPIPARALQAVASSAGTTRSGPPERRSARIASSAGAAGDSPKSSGAAGSTLFVFPVYFLEFLAFPALIRYTRLVKV